MVPLSVTCSAMAEAYLASPAEQAGKMQMGHSWQLALGCQVVSLPPFRVLHRHSLTHFPRDSDVTPLVSSPLEGGGALALEGLLCCGKSH